MTNKILEAAGQVPAFKLTLVSEDKRTSSFGGPVFESDVVGASAQRRMRKRCKVSLSSSFSVSRRPRFFRLGALFVSRGDQQRGVLRTELRGPAPGGDRLASPAGGHRNAAGGPQPALPEGHHAPGGKIAAGDDRVHGQRHPGLPGLAGRPKGHDEQARLRPNGSIRAIGPLGAGGSLGRGREVLDLQRGLGRHGPVSGNHSGAPRARDGGTGRSSSRIPVASR